MQKNITFNYLLTSLNETALWWNCFDVVENYNGKAENNVEVKSLEFHITSLNYKDNEEIQIDDTRDETEDQEENMGEKAGREGNKCKDKSTNWTLLP